MTPETIASPLVRPVTGRGWKNPIFRRYCQSRLRPKSLLIWLLVTLMIAGFIFAMTRSSLESHSKLSAEDIARAPLIPLLVLQSFILFVIGTAQVAGGMVAERDEGVIDYQRLIPMSPLSKVLGYLFGLPVKEYVLVFATLPFTGWCLWKGEVAFDDWATLYGVFFSSALLYHCTGLVTGTVVKNRRWAFLVSIGLVFGLYTVIPQAARFGLVFFKYLTITPVFEERMAGLVPEATAALVRVGQRLMPTVKFFNLDFSEAVFTFFSQGGLVLAFLVMLCRKWRRQESHLLGKVGAVALFIWVQILLLGNALPLVDSGTLFPSRGISRFRTFDFVNWQPKGEEAMLMSGFYGLSTLALLFVLSGIITASPDGQVMGWRRARKQGRQSLPFFSDPATGSWFTVVMAVAGGVGWYLFTRGLIESRWFPGQTVPLSVLGVFVGVMVSAGLGFQALMESRGGRAIGLAFILLGMAPMMVGSVVAVVNERLAATAVWIIGMSPLSLPLYASSSLLHVSVLPPMVVRAIPNAFAFWLGVLTLVTIRQILQLAARRRERARKGLANPD